MKTNFADAGCRMPDAGCRILCGRLGHERRRIGRRSSAIAGALLLGFCALPQARADLSAPDNILYGIVVLGTNLVTADSTDFVVEARRADGLPIAHYRMGDRPNAGNNYVLAIKVEEIAPLRDPSSVLLNQTVTIVVASNGIDQAQQNFKVTERGQATQLDFGSLPTNVLSGFAAWAFVRGLGTASQDDDADGDGVSNLAEYLAGTSPTNAASQFALRIARTNATTRVSFDALRAEGTGYENRTRHYALERVADLHQSTWQPVPGFSDVVGANQSVVYEALAADAPQLFRGKVWLQGGGGTPTGELRLLVSRSASQTTISFTALGPDDQGRNRYYTLERVSNLGAGLWTAVPGYSNVLGNNQTITYSFSTAATGSGFYRARLELRNP